MKISNFTYKEKEGRTHGKHHGEAKFVMDETPFEGECVNSDDSHYVKLEDNVGLKIIKNNEARYGTLEEASENLDYFKTKKINIFPEIIEHNIDADKLLMKVKHLEDKDLPHRMPSWIPKEDHEFVKRELQAPLDLLNKLNNVFIDEKITPEDEWCKKGNIIGDKIIDFHRFKIDNNRYEIPTEANPEDCQKIFNNAVGRYLARGDNKWKGKIYQGHTFSNGHVFKGYKSDGINFDSYRKLNFYYLNKARGKKVLDLGCNEGFFSTQASLAGAESVTSIDSCKEDILLASEIRDEITGLKNIDYIEGDAVDFVKNDTNKYNLTFLSSVLHQIYPNAKGAEEFIGNIARRTEYLCFESTANHKLMNISLEQIREFFANFFHGVRFLFAYDAYSSGYRVIFMCWNPK
jgi:2-polyprenyl-3-methyl-5-hydroxy-6-metoxy-1,4-benzoquinol methylase|tara:strand:- start:105 stop:1319 length:1215 start_codon:yes stop_codon:yes gene_type:complete